MNNRDYTWPLMLMASWLLVVSVCLLVLKDRMDKHDLAPRKAQETVNTKPVVVPPNSTTNKPRVTVFRVASVYSDCFVGRATSSGMRFRQDWPIVASELPNGTLVKITRGDRSVYAFVADKTARRFYGRRIDLSRSLWSYLSKNATDGLMDVKVEVLKAAQESVEKRIARGELPGVRP